MELFDGKYKSKPKISLAGSSRQVSRDKLIQEAILERKRREEEKRQQQAALKIQSAFRSFAARQRVKSRMRAEFKQLFARQNPNDIQTLISYFTLFFNEKADQEDLNKLCQFILKHKDTILMNLVGDSDSSKCFEFSLVKFLMIIFKTLNKKSHSLSDSLALRLVDFFTDPKSYAPLHNSNATLATILHFFLTHGFVDELVKYAQAKIPGNASHAPLVFVIGHFLHRVFLFLDLHKSPGASSAKNVIVNTLCKQFLTKCQSSSHARLLLAKLAQIIGESQDRPKMLANLVEFIEGLATLVESPNSTFAYDDYASILYSVLALCAPLIGLFSAAQLYKLIYLMHLLVFRAFSLDFSFEESGERMSVDDEALSDEHREQGDDDEEVVDVLSEAIALIESKKFVERVEWLLATEANEQHCYLISFLTFLVLEKSDTKPHQSLFLRKVAFNRPFLSSLWRYICSAKLDATSELSYLQLLASGSCAKLYFADLYKIVAPLSTFCSLYNLFLLPILDAEFLKGEAIFTKLELIKMSAALKDVCAGLIQLMHPDTSFANIIDLTSQEGSSFEHTGFAGFSVAPPKASIDSKIKKTTLLFAHLFQACSQLVQRLYTRDIRSGFCPEDHWLSNYQLVSLSRLSDILHLLDPSILTNVKFGQASHMFQEDFEKENKLNVSEIRSLAILQELPFTIGFADRMKILESFIHQEARYSPSDRAYKLRVRRDFMYEDAFDNLSLENVPNLKNVRLVVEMINQLGLDEAGIDGGGVFREFMLGLLENAFDPTRGFFLLTSDGFLYPNPNVGFIVENYQPHYFFLGRIIGKAIQSKILSSLKFAMFFLQKILGKYTDTRLDIDYLASLDPEVYKNLIYLKNLKSNMIDELGLNFAINVSEFGRTKTIELKPGGKDIQVTGDNKIEYIHLLADYKLNKQIHEQVVAFRNGLANVIDLDLLRLFNFNELQFLISGSDETIDVVDWRLNTVYSGTYSSDHPVIKNFWKIVESLSEEHKRKLLKFVTSRSRMPLFGFKNLIPIFAIHSSGNEQRLPTASTCLNLLKLPPIEDFELLKDKIICAIESDSGFELS